MPKIASLALRRLSIVLWVFFGRDGLHRVVGFKYRHSSFLSFSLGLDPLFPLLSGCFRRMGRAWSYLLQCFFDDSQSQSLAQRFRCRWWMDGKVVALLARQLL